MSQTDVRCRTNSTPISVKLLNENRNYYTFTIAPKSALIDENNCIRFFTLEYNDGQVCSYKLHPMQGKIAWIADFLIGYGLTRIGGRLFVASGNAAQQEITHLGRYFTFGNPGGQTIRSFISNHFPSSHLGYHNVMTDKLAWVEPIYLK